MIKKLKISLASLAMLALVLVGAGSARAAAGDLVWSADQTLDLTIDLTIITGSTASSLVITDPTITANVASGDTFRVATASAGSFTVDDMTGVGLSCNSSNQAQVEIVATSTVAHVITPSTTPCIYASGGGSGGGGGGGGGSSADITPPTGSVSINAGATATASTAVTLSFTSNDASSMMISNDGAFVGATWEAYATTKAWTLLPGEGAKTVYVKFRDASNNVSGVMTDGITFSLSTIPAIPATPGTEIPGCGNRTTGFSNSTGASCVGNTATTPATPATPAHKVYNFGTVTLKNGSKGEAVKELQRFLNAVLNLGLVVDGKLGPKTIAVIKAWQKGKGLVADGLIGPKTKAMMNASAQ